MSVPTNFKAALLHAPGDLRIEMVDMPEIGDHEILVKIQAATTCGTDKKTFKRGHPVLVPSYPSRIGHEMAGEIAQTGEKVSRFQVGDRVVIPNSAPCLNCYFCKKDSPNLCENLIFLNGAYAEYIVVPQQIVENNLHKLPENLSFEKACLTEPLACVIHACDLIDTKPGDKVAILGTGPMSYLFVQVLKSKDRKPLVIGRTQNKLDFFKSCGAWQTVNNTNANWQKEIKELCDGYGPDVTIEAVGLPELWQSCFETVRPGGKVLFYGGCKKEDQLNIQTYRMHYQEISLFGVFHHTPEAIKKAISILSTDQIDTTPLLQETRDLEDLRQILSDKDDSKSLKYLVLP